MANACNYLAVDLGAESGRTIIGTLNGKHLVLTETHRFLNRPVRLPDGLHWDILRLWEEIKTGLSRSAARFDGQVHGIGVDTWGVDFALLDKNGGLLSNPFHYRDARTDGMLDQAFKLMPRVDIYASTGIQFMQINTLYQLLAMALQQSPLLEAAQTFVTLPDLFNYWLSGEITNEFTNATTTQCFDPRNRNWASGLLDRFGIPLHLFRPVVEPGTQIGTLRPQIAEETGLGKILIVAPACHDTGSAVVSVPADNENFAWISSGTWSILGAEVREPIVSSKALQNNFTNEGGVAGTWRLSKNVMGLWLVQECRRAWRQQLNQDFTYDELTHLASETRPFLAVIDPDWPDFLHLGDMPERIRKYCAKTNQPAPETTGEIVRVALESIALKYRWVLERLEELMGMRLEPIHMIGGGTKNRLLNQFTADATGRIVVAGPSEATAIGNVLMQAVGFGHLGSLAEARAVVRNSFVSEVYTPDNTHRWDQAYGKLLNFLM
jgi:rhamnulokinase